MSCAACSSSVERAVGNLNGVEEVNVNLTTGKLSVLYNEETISVSDIENTVLKIGFGVSKDTFEDNFDKKQNELKSMKNRLVFSLVFAIPLFYISMGHMAGLPVPKFMDPMQKPLTFALVQLVLALFCVVSGYRFYTVGYKKLFTLNPNMDSLVAVGTSAAFVYGLYLMYDMCVNKGINHSHNLYFESVGVIITLIQLGKYLENRSKLRTNDAILKLIELSPKKATVIRNGQKIQIDTRLILQGDVVVILPGEKIPVDAEVIDGTTTVDEAMLTGESVPVEKTVGSKVFAGCINKTGYIEAKALTTSEETVISKIISMVEEASGSKPKLALLADKICSIFVPCVMGISVLTLIIWLIVGAPFSVVVDRFISVLVVACPCALGLATPTAVIVSMGIAAREGILIKDAEALERLNLIDTLVFDKTGTLTMGTPRVTDVVTFNGFEKDDVLSYALTLEEASTHPLSEAVCTYAKENGILSKKAENLHTQYGKGLKATVNGKEVLLGSYRFMTENDISNMCGDDIAEKLTSEGNTLMYMSVEGVMAAIISAKDTLKPTSKKLMDILHSLNKKTVLLTGDNELSAKAVSKEIGVDECIWEVLPSDKADKIKELISNGKKVAMVGDGINDSVALTVADVGISVGTGTEIAIEAADVVIMKNDMTDIYKAIRISNLAIKNIKQNLFYAFIYNTILIPIAAGVFSFAGFTFNPMFAASAMALSSVSVVTNALRLKKIKL